jgi:glyoxylase-like metal-dependent hydrolase (beta-lactamase superfamily II)
MSDLPDRQVPGAHHRRVGDLVVTAPSDGYLDAPLELLQNVTADQAGEILAAAFRPSPPRISINAYAVRTGERTLLIETGAGTSMGPTLGWLPRSLAAAAIDPAEVETVLLTHMHPDHSNGLSDGAGVAAFPNAELVLHEDEVAHWSDDGAMARATERQRERYFLAARAQLVPYRDRLRPFRRGEVWPGVTALPIPGHTPGHTVYLIESSGESLLLWGDTVHVPEIQVARPEVTLEFDSDPEAAAAMRRRVFDMVAAERLLVAGMHLHFPGFAHLTRHRSGYHLLPEAWSFTV